MDIKRRLWTGLLLLLLLSAAFPAGAYTQSQEAADSFGNGREQGIAMEVVYGYDNHAKGGCYIPIRIELMNEDVQAFQGELQILTMESDYDIYRYDYPVEIPARGQTSPYMYIPVGNRTDQMFVSLVDEAGQKISHKRLKLNFSLEVPELFIGILSDTPEKLQAWDGVGVDYGMLRTRTVNFSTETFPEEEMGLDMIDVLLISNYRIRDLSEKQSRVLIEWVRGGGTMILGGGMRVDDTLGRFAPELLEEAYEEPALQQVHMGIDYAQDNPSDSVLEIPCVDFVLSGGTTILEDEGRTLLASVNYTRGTVVAAAYDFADLDQFCQKNPSYIDHILTEILGETKINRLAEAVYSGNSDQYWSVRNMINTGNVRLLPKLGLYVFEIVIYIFLVGFGVYIFLRQRDLTCYYRSGVVILSLMFTVIIYLMGSSTRFTDIFYTYARFVETTSDTISETTYTNIQAPYNKPYTAYLDPDYSIKPVTRSHYYENGMLPRFTGSEDYHVAIGHQADQTMVSVQNVPAFESKYFQLNKITENEKQAGFYGELEMERGRIRGAITNQFQRRVGNCAVLLYDKLIYLGDMEPGETRELEGLPMLEYPRGQPYQVAAYLSGESAYERADIDEEGYVEAVERTNLLAYYLDRYTPAYTQNARVVGIFDGADEELTFLKKAAEGHTVAASLVEVYSSDDEVVYRPAVVKQPNVLSGNYDEKTNTLYGVDPVTLEYSLGNDVRIEKLILDYVSEEFITQDGSSRLISFAGNLFFYNHSIGVFDKMDPLKSEYKSEELTPYLSPGNTITIKYAYENMSEYNWNVLLPMLNIVGRNKDAKD